MLLYPTLLNTMLFKASCDLLVHDDIARQTCSISATPHDLPIFIFFFYYIVIFSSFQNRTFMAYLTDKHAIICLFEPAMPHLLGKSASKLTGYRSQRYVFAITLSIAKTKGNANSKLSFQRRFRSYFCYYVHIHVNHTVPVGICRWCFLAATLNARLIPETRSIAHLSVSCDALTDHLMHSTYFFVRSDTAAAVAW